MTILTKSTYLKGPKGDTGPVGPKGDRGPTGLQGPQGAQGPAADSQVIRNLFASSGNITYNVLTGVIGFADPGYATITYVDNAIANLVNNAPAVLDTIKEIADAINNDPNFYNNKLSVSGGTMTGALFLNADPVANLEAATKQYVDNATSSIVTSYNDLTDKPTLFSGSYTDLIDKPAIPNVPTNISAFNNDAGYLTTVGTISYNSLDDKPAIPTDINDLTDIDGLLGQGGAGDSTWSGIKFDGGTDFISPDTENYSDSEFILEGNNLDIPVIVAVPTTSSSVGEPGQIAYDFDYVYICIASNTWKRSLLTSW